VLSLLGDCRSIQRCSCMGLIEPFLHEGKARGIYLYSLLGVLTAGNETGKTVQLIR